jgi:hypothetical protein
VRSESDDELNDIKSFNNKDDSPDDNGVKTPHASPMKTTDEEVVQEPATVEHKDQLLALLVQLSPEQTATLMKTILYPGAGSTASLASTSTANIQALNQVPPVAAVIQKPDPLKHNQDSKTDS